MKIIYHESGGFAGLQKKYEFDSDTGSKEEADRLLSLIDNSDFFDIAQSEDNFRPDSVLHSITIDFGDRKKTLNVSSAAAPEKLKPLIKTLSKKSSYTKNR